MGMEEEAKQTRISTGDIARVVREVLKENEKTKEEETKGQELVNEVKGLKGMICDPVSGKCWLPTKNDLAEIKGSVPQIFGGHNDLSSLFRALEKGDSQLDEAIQGRIPAPLKARWVQEWCKDGECRTLLEKAGFEIDDGEKKRGAFPGS
jgi:hypothetical protein